jgi:CBS-domain-containing membrane protein
MLRASGVAEETMVKVAMWNTLRVKDVMTEALLLLRAEMSIDEAWSLLHESGLTGAPVLDLRGRLVGMLSFADLADPRRRQPEGGYVREVMTRVVFAVRADDPVLSAVRLMEDENVHQIVVLNDDGTLAGIVVPMDILRVLTAEAESRGASAHVEYVDLWKLNHSGLAAVATLRPHREREHSAPVGRFESGRFARGVRVL